MKVRYKSISLAVAFFVSVFLLVGCNDDSSSSSSDIKYTGSTDQVLIDETNAVEVATNAYGNMYSIQTTGDFANIGAILENSEGTPAMPHSVALALSIIDILEKAEPQTEALCTGAVETWVEYGDCGGEAVFSGSYDIYTDEISMTIKFEDYCTEGITYNGTVKMEGSFLDQLTMTFKKLESTFVGSGQSITMSGTMVGYYESDSSILFVMNMTIRDNATDKTYKVENLDVEIIDSGSEVEVSLTGRFYDHDNGYCDISTEVSLKFLANEVTPYEGALLITGDTGIAGGSTKACFTIIDQSSYYVEADTNGDGTFNYNSGTLTW